MNAEQPQSQIAPHNTTIWVKIPVIIGVLTVIWVALHYIISNEIRTALDEPKQQITEMKKDVAQLQEDTKSIKIQLGNITPSSLNNLVVPPGTKISETDLTAQLRRASGLIDFALQARFPASPDAISPLLHRASLLRIAYKANPRILSEIDSTSVRLSGYAVASGQMLKGQSLATVKPEVGAVIPPSGWTLANFTADCDAPPGNFINFDTDTNPRRLLVVANDIHIIRCKQSLDGAKWIKDDFNGSLIRYRGGPLFLADVSFKNCTFDFGDDLRSQTALAAIKDSDGKPMSIVIE
jgi:hypothetical protein